jgi:hypothetical protein
MGVKIHKQRKRQKTENNLAKGLLTTKRARTVETAMGEEGPRRREFRATSAWMGSYMR